MNLQLKNLGPIKKGTIPLNHDLIILCGPNNTGKTYLAYSIFGLYNEYEKSKKIEHITSKSQRNQIFEHLYEHGSVEVNLIDLFNLSYLDFQKYLSDKLVNDLPNIFDVPEKNTLFEHVQLNINFNKPKTYEDAILNISYKIDLHFGQNILEISKDKFDPICKIFLIRENSEMMYDKNSSPFNNRNILENYMSYTLDEILLDSILKNVYIAPAERASINLFSGELSSNRRSLIDDLNRMSDKRKTIPLEWIQYRTKRYSLPIMESLKLSSDLNVLKRRDSKYSYLASYLENEILDGKIDVSETGELVFTTKQTDIQLGIHLTASIVKSLANIVFYFRHLAKENDFVIIDEPELNLHPDNQRKIAKFIGKVVNAGFKVLISTHSDYIIREFNNLIMLNNQSPEVDNLLKEFHYKKDETLDYTRIGVHLLKSDGVVENVKVDPTGFSVSTIVEQINKQAEASDKIYYTLYDNE